MKTGYEFTVQGRYYAENEHGGQTLKFYKKEVFVLPEIVTYVCGKKWEYYTEGNLEKKRPVPNIKRQNALKCFKYMIKNYYLDQRLKEKYPDYKNFQTFDSTKRVQIKLTPDKLKEFSLEGDIADMSESQLVQFVALKGLEVDLTPYADLADKKEAVRMVIEENTVERPGISRPLTEEEKDLLPPEDVFLSTSSSVDEEDFSAFQ